MTTSANRRPLLLLILIAFILRLVWGQLQPTTESAIDRLPDQREYLLLGQSLLHEHKLYFFDHRFEQDIYAYRTPGYPLLIAACGGSLRIIRLVQALLDTTTVIAVYLLARQLSGSSALLAAALVAFNPFLIYFSGLILSETLFISLLTWSFVYWTNVVAFEGAVLAAAAAMVRPSMIPLAILLAFLATVLNPPSPSTYLLKTRVKKVTISTSLALGVLVFFFAPWAVRNSVFVNDAVWTTTNAGITLYDGFHPGADGSSDQRFLEQMTELRSMNELRRDHYLTDQARQWATTHRLESLKLAVVKIARTWSPVPLSAEFGKPVYCWIAGAYAIPFDVCLLMGLFFSKMNRKTKCWLLLPALVFTLIHALSVGSLRYRIPMEPVLAVLASAGVARGVNTKKLQPETH